MIALVVHGIFSTRENKTSWFVAPRSKLSQRSSEISTRVLWFEPIGGLHPQRCAHAERKKKDCAWQPLSGGTELTSWTMGKRSEFPS